VLSSSSERPNQTRRLAGAAFATLLVRFLAGYEFVTATAAIAAAPVLYYAVRDSWPARVLRRRVLTLGAAALAALIVSLAALALQVMAVPVRSRVATNHIRFAIGRRTRGDSRLFPPVYARRPSSPTSDVLRSLPPGSRRPRRGIRAGSSRVADVAPLRRAHPVDAPGRGWVAARTAWAPNRAPTPAARVGAATLLALLGTLAWLYHVQGALVLPLHDNPIMWHLMFLPFERIPRVRRREDAAASVARRVGLYTASSPRRSDDERLCGMRLSIVIPSLTRSATSERCTTGSLRAAEVTADYELSSSTTAARMLPRN